MNDRNFRQLLEVQWSRGNFVCVGLDSDYEKIPEVAEMKLFSVGGKITSFNFAIVDATRDLVCAYKLNTAFYEAYGTEGWTALRQTIEHIHRVTPDVPVIIDAKRGDISSTNAGYVQMAFEFLQADAITVHPYLGAEALQPFLARVDKGIIVLCRTSNPGADEFQHMLVATDWAHDGTMPFYQYVAFKVAKDWNENGNCGVVVGTTYPEELREVRGIVGDMPILIPDIGAQGSDVEKTVTAGKDSRGQGMIINSSCGIIFASKGVDFAEAARRETEKLRDMINEYR